MGTCYLVLVIGASGNASKVDSTAAKTAESIDLGVCCCYSTAAAVEGKEKLYVGKCRGKQSGEAVKLTN